MLVGMIPKISRGSDPAGLLKYLFGKGRANEHTDQHMVACSDDMLAMFDFDGKPDATFKEIAHAFDRRWRVLKNKDKPSPPDRRSLKSNPEQKEGLDRVWHCSLSIKHDQGVLTDEQWDMLVRDFLKRMNIIADDTHATWVAVRHGVSRNGNDHVHIMVQLAAQEGWINPYNDRKEAQQSCRSMEQAYDFLTPLDLSVTCAPARYTFAQWRRWAEWKTSMEYTDTWASLSATERELLVNRVGVETLPLLHVAQIVRACASASASEDEFIRRVRREGLNIDPRLRRGTVRGDFRDPDQVVGYTVTWRSRDGWRVRLNATSLGSDMRLKEIRKRWAHDPRSQALAVAEWRASMENRPPMLNDGRERHLEHLSTLDLERMVAQAFTIATQVNRATSPDEYRKAMADGLHAFHKLYDMYGAPNTASLAVADVAEKEEHASPNEPTH